MKINILFALLCLFSSSMAQAALGPEAQNYLKQIPEQKLTVNFVIKTALQKADSYKLIGYDYSTSELEEMGKVDSITDTVFVLDGSYADDNSAKTTPFQPLRTKHWNWSAGFQKNWETGTTTSVRWLQDSYNLQYGNLGTFGSSFLNQYKQSAAEISLEQNLLKNTFGFAQREKRRAARARGAGIQWKTRNDLETLTSQFIGQYYQAWLMQQQVASLQDQVARQKRLVRILTQRSRKGVVETPDLIQVKALLAASQTRLTKAKSDLSNLWDQLAISLDFPESLLKVNPMDVPTSIDNPVPLSLRVCGLKEPIKTSEIHALEKNLEGLAHDFKAAKNESLPDVKLVAAYRGNSIGQQASANYQNVLKGTTAGGYGLGPAWNVGVKLSWPLNNSGARALRTEKYIQKEKVAAQLKVAVDQLKTQWRDSCRRLKTEWDNEKTFENVVGQQKKRVQAELRRFRLGRIRVDQLVNAENDLGDWEFQSQQKKVEVRKLAWDVQKYSGDMYRYLAPYVEELLK